MTDEAMSGAEDIIIKRSWCTRPTCNRKPVLGCVIWNARTIDVSGGLTSLGDGDGSHYSSASRVISAGKYSDPVRESSV